MDDQQLSLLSGEEIKELRLVEDAEDACFRASTYDLSIAEIIPSGGIPWENSKFSLSPGGMVRVVSKEYLRLPETITAHVLLKNQLCTQGVLAISIGVIDPGFEGPISSTLINFGRETCEIKKGDCFLRASFFRCPFSEKVKTAQKHTRSGYLQRVRQEVLAYSGPTFLNMEAMTTKAAEKAFQSFKEGVLVWATLWGIVLAALAIFAPLGASLVDKYVTRSEQHDAQMEQKIEKEVESRYESRLNALTEQIQKLKPASTGQRNATTNRQ